MHNKSNPQKQKEGSMALGWAIVLGLYSIPWGIFLSLILTKRAQERK
ncbi:hypothetical protein [Vaginisenegalia massiliensis]|nr:hypothetical protein [Vaginisenegalia massiliensis]